MFIIAPICIIYRIVTIFFDPIRSFLLIGKLKINIKTRISISTEKIQPYAWYRIKVVLQISKPNSFILQLKLETSPKQRPEVPLERSYQTAIWEIGLFYIS